jgi:hypothetical protein
LIKKCTLYANFPILKKLILVDVPGLHDSNIAREEITRKYIKSCKYMGIVR